MVIFNKINYLIRLVRGYWYFKYKIIGTVNMLH